MRNTVHGKAYTGKPALYYFRKWVKNGVFDEIIAYLVEKERLRQGRAAQVTAGAIDSQIGPPKRCEESRFDFLRYRH